MSKMKRKASYIPASLQISPFTPQTERARRGHAADPIQEGIKKTKRKVYYGDAAPFAVGFARCSPLIAVVGIAASVQVQPVQLRI